MGNADESHYTGIPCATCGLGPEHHHPPPLATTGASSTVHLITVSEHCVVCGLTHQSQQVHSAPDYAELATLFNSELEHDYDSESETIYSDSDFEDEANDRQQDFVEHPLNFAQVPSRLSGHVHI